MEFKKRLYRPLGLSKEMLNMPFGIKIIAFIVFLYTLGWGIVTPFLPIYYKSVLGSYTAVGIVTALLPLFSLLVDIPAGGIINRVSKIKTMRLMLLLYLPFSFFFVSLRNITHFIFFRIYHSAIATPFWIAADSYARENAPKWKAAQAISLYDVAITLSMIIGPAIGGLLFSRFGFSLLYAVSLFAGFAFLATFILKDKEPHERARDAARELIFVDGVYKRSIVDFLQNKLLVKVYSFVFLFRFCASFVVMLLPLFLKEYGASNLQIGLVFGIYYLPLLFEPYFSLYAKNKRLMTMGLLLCAILFVSLFANNRLSFIFFHAILLSLLFAAIIPMLNGRIVELMPREQVGELSGVGMMFSHVADFAGPLIAGVVSDVFGLRFVFLIGASVAVVLTLLSMRKSFRMVLFG